MDKADFKRLQNLIEPCLTPEDLDRFIFDHLGIELPWQIVDQDSTSSSLKFVWEVNKFFLTGEGPNRHVVAASRNTAKSLTSSIIQFISMLHFRRDGVHLAATQAQAAALIKYINKYLRNPLLAPYADTNNVKVKRFVNLPPNDFTLKNQCSLEVATATIRGVNSQRSSCFDKNTEILVLRKPEEIYGDKGRYKPMLIKGVHKRVQAGEEICVASFNNKTGAVESKRVTHSYKNLKSDRIKITTESGKEIVCTPEHPFVYDYTGEFLYKEAEKFNVGENLFIKRNGSIGYSEKNNQDMFNRPKVYPYIEQKFDENKLTAEEIIIGSMLGDGCVSKRKFTSDCKLDANGDRVPYKGNALFAMTKTCEAREYSKYVANKLSFDFKADSNKSGYGETSLDSVRSGQNEQMTILWNKWYDDSRNKIIPRDIKLTYGSLAVLLMDDGHIGLRRISTHSFSEQDVLFLCSLINDLLGRNAAEINHERKADGRVYPIIDLKFGHEHLDQYLEIASYLHPDYYYKNQRVPRECVVCGNKFYMRTTANICDSSMCIFEKYCTSMKLDKIVSIERYQETNTRHRFVYDLTVEDNHNYFANGISVHNCLSFDELDLTPSEIISEASHIADPALVIRPDGTRYNLNPAFIYLSSRKTNNGPIQDLIDEAEDKKSFKKKPRLHKWSTVDWMKKCPTEVHKPELGSFKAYINTENLQTIWSKEELDTKVSSAAQSQYNEVVAFEGCRTCDAWVACQGRSVNQQGDSFMLRSREFVGDVLSSVKDPSSIIAQSLNWKPETTGLVFKTFSHSKHVRSPIDFYEWVSFGESFNPDKLNPEELLKHQNGTDSQVKRVTPTKEQIYKAMKKHGWFITCGTDWGFTDPAIATIAGWHKKRERLAVLHVAHAFGFANHSWVDYIAHNIHTRFPIELAAPDQADPSSVTYFAKHKIPSLGRKDKPKKIATGISKIRGLLWDPQKQEVNFAILDDSETEDCNKFMIEEMLNYTHARDPLGKFIMDKFEDKHNHTVDSVRYLLHPFTKAQPIHQSAIQYVSLDNKREIMEGVRRNDPEAIVAAADKNLLKNQLEDHYKSEHGVTGTFKKVDKPAESPEKPKNSGSIKFSI